MVKQLLCMASVGALLLLGQCRSEHPVPAASRLPTELTAYTLFWPGTHWIYRDSATGQLDSVWVTRTDTMVTQRGRAGQWDDRYQDFATQVRTSVRNRLLRFEVLHVCTFSKPGEDSIPPSATRPTEPCWVVLRRVDLQGSTNDSEGTGVFPYAVRRGSRQRVSVPSTVAHVDWTRTPQQVGAAVYPDVLTITLEGDLSEGGLRTHYTWARHVGIVRQRIWRQGQWQTWLLVRSRIRQ